MSYVGRAISRWAQSVTTVRRRSAGYRTLGRLQRAVEVQGQTAASLEGEARAVEKAVGETAEAEGQPIDLNLLAEKVFQLFTRELRLDRERVG
jgi:hypothetical protein